MCLSCYNRDKIVSYLHTGLISQLQKNVLLETTQATSINTHLREFEIWAQQTCEAAGAEVESWISSLSRSMGFATWLLVLLLLLLLVAAPPVAARFAVSGAAGPEGETASPPKQTQVNMFIKDASNNLTSVFTTRRVRAGTT